jgi:hypothetical protein
VAKKHGVSSQTIYQTLYMGHPVPQPHLTLLDVQVRNKVAITTAAGRAN